MNYRKLGIVILNYNSFELVSKCIESITKYYDKTIKIVIVDNQSSDDSYKLLKENYSSHPSISILLSEYNKGYSYGNNIGLKYLINNYCDLEYFAVLNPDVFILDGNIFQNLIARLQEDDSLAGISPLMIVNNEIKPNRWAIKNPRYINNFLSSYAILRSINPLIYKSYTIRSNSLVAYVDVIPGSFYIMKKDVFIQIGLLDENVFLYGEEIIIGRKVKNIKYKLGISFRDFYMHNHSPEDISFKRRLIHLKLSLKSHLYFNFTYNNIFWGTIDSILLIIFLPLKALEIILIHWLLRIKRS